MTIKLFRETAAYALIAMLVALVAAAATAPAVLLGGPLGLLAGVAGAAVAVQALRRPVGTALGALADGL